MFTRSKTLTRFLIVSLVPCAALAAGLLIASQIVSAAGKPIPGIGVTVKKNPGKNTSNARTNQNGQFTASDLEPGSYTVSLKHAEKHAPPDSFKTAVITLEGVRGGTLIKRVPLADLRRGVTLEIEIVGRSAGTITGTCMATDEEK